MSGKAPKNDRVARKVREGSIGVKAARRRGSVLSQHDVRLWPETVGAGVVGAIWVEAQHLEARCVR